MWKVYENTLQIVFPRKQWVFHIYVSLVPLGWLEKNTGQKGLICYKLDLNGIVILGAS